MLRKIFVAEQVGANATAKRALVEPLEGRTFLSATPLYFGGFTTQTYSTQSDQVTVSHKTKKVVTPISATVTDVTPTSASTVFLGSFKGYKQYVNVTITNSSAAAGKLSETYTLYASTSAEGNVGGVAIGSGKVSVKLGANGSAVGKILVNPPTTLPAGGYYIYAVPSGKGADPNSGGRSASTVSIVAPSVTLEDNRIDPPLDITKYQPQATIHYTKTTKFVLPLTNSGNAPATGKADLQLIFSKDGTLNGTEGFVVMSVQNAKVKVNPGATQKFTLTIKKFALPAGFTAGNYFACVKVIGHDALGQLNTLNAICANETPVAVVA